jgi:hypothetical protein
MNITRKLKKLVVESYGRNSTEKKYARIHPEKESDITYPKEQVIETGKVYNETESIKGELSPEIRKHLDRMKEIKRKKISELSELDLTSMKSLASEKSLAIKEALATEGIYKYNINKYNTTKRALNNIKEYMKKVEHSNTNPIIRDENLFDPLNPERTPVTKTFNKLDESSNFPKNSDESNTSENMFVPNKNESKIKKLEAKLNELKQKYDRILEEISEHNTNQPTVDDVLDSNGKNYIDWNIKMKSLISDLNTTKTNINKVEKDIIEIMKKIESSRSKKGGKTRKSNRKTSARKSRRY